MSTRPRGVSSLNQKRIRGFSSNAAFRLHGIVNQQHEWNEEKLASELDGVEETVQHINRIRLPGPYYSDSDEEEGCEAAEHPREQGNEQSQIIECESQSNGCTICENEIQQNQPTSQPTERKEEGWIYEISGIWLWTPMDRYPRIWNGCFLPNNHELVEEWYRMYQREPIKWPHPQAYAQQQQ